LLGTAHERRVMDIALGMYSLLQPIHQLPPRYRRMLKIGALVHDVGRHRGSDRHHIRGARMVAKARYLNITPEERIFAAYAARYHRGPIPTGEDSARLLPSEHFRPMRILLAILRAADALDKRRLTPPTILLKRTGYQLRVAVVTGPSHYDTLRKALDGRRKFRMLSNELDVSVKLKLRCEPA